MKIEIEKDFPQYFKPAYPEEFELFSHFEVTAGIPTVLFAVTTWKENGKPNVCFHSWSCFHGDKTAFFAVMGNLYQHTHTYANIQREKCFCINFLPISCYDKLVNTIHQNEWGDDEFDSRRLYCFRRQNHSRTCDQRSVSHDRMCPERNTGFKRCGDYGYGDRKGTAYLCGGSLCTRV